MKRNTLSFEEPQLRIKKRKVVGPAVSPICQGQYQCLNKPTRRVHKLNGLTEDTCVDHTGKDYRDLVDLLTGESLLPKDEDFELDTIGESNEGHIPSA